MGTPKPKLPLTEDERKRLRQAKIKLEAVVTFTTEQLMVTLDSTSDRARTLLAYAKFQAVPSIGPSLAQNLIELCFYDLNDIKSSGETGEQLVDRLERLHGVRMDPCVEDVMRLAVHHANEPGSAKQWWDFTAERKVYRKQNGYPEDRPIKAWHM